MKKITEKGKHSGRGQRCFKFNHSIWLCGHILLKHIPHTKIMSLHNVLINNNEIMFKGIENDCVSSH